MVVIDQRRFLAGPAGSTHEKGGQNEETAHELLAIMVTFLKE
jgi:hypothetical protein